MLSSIQNENNSSKQNHWYHPFDSLKKQSCHYFLCKRGPVVKAIAYAYDSKILLILSATSLSDSVLMFSYFIHFDFNLVQGERYGSGFNLWAAGFPSTIYWRAHLSSSLCFGLFAKDGIVEYAWDCFWILCSVLLIFQYCGEKEWKSDLQNGKNY